MSQIIIENDKAVSQQLVDFNQGDISLGILTAINVSQHCPKKEIIKGALKKQLLLPERLRILFKYIKGLILKE